MVTRNLSSGGLTAEMGQCSSLEDSEASLQGPEGVSVGSRSGLGLRSEFCQRRAVTALRAVSMGWARPWGHSTQISNST